MTEEREKETLVVGAWNFVPYFYENGAKCPVCNGPMVETPRNGHINSKYWKLENNGEVLTHCSNGCLEVVNKVLDE